MYEYVVRLVRVIDGDTVVLDADVGFNIWRINQPYRLLRINAPEIDTDLGKKAKAGLEIFLESKKMLVGRTQKYDKYGRYLVDLTADGENVSDWLVASGLAVYKTY